MVVAILLLPVLVVCKTFAVPLGGRCIGRFISSKICARGGEHGGFNVRKGGVDVAVLLSMSAPAAPVDTFSFA